MVCKLSTNGVAGFLLANGALGDPDTVSIRRQLILNHLVEAIIVLPRDMFYSTDISVTLWIVNKNKGARVVDHNGEVVKYRDRRNEVLFVDLRRKGELYEKKYIQLTEDDSKEVVSTYHNWQQAKHEQSYKNVPEYCYSATREEIEKNNFSLIPSKYIEFTDKDSDIDYDKEMRRIQKKFSTILGDEVDSQKGLLQAFKNLGYEIKL
jgi:type I restriction enzyme M protein